MYEVILLKKAKKDLHLLAQTGAWLDKAEELIKILRSNPYQNPPPYEKLRGEERYSRRINIQHRLVYEVDKLKKEIYILSMVTTHLTNKTLV